MADLCRSKGTNANEGWHGFLKKHLRVLGGVCSIGQLRIWLQYFVLRWNANRFDKRRVK
jgi:hypothetical protein